MSDVAQMADTEKLSRLVVESVTRGEKLRCGDTLSVWEEGEHPYGKANPCPFCKSEQSYTSFWYNGPGSPPSYAWFCQDCGAQGPTSNGRFKGDHYGAIMDAIQLWNHSSVNEGE